MPETHRLKWAMFIRRSQNSESETSLLQRAADWSSHATIESLTAETLQQITKNEGVDFATALLFDRFSKSKRHAEFIQRIESLRDCSSVTSAAIDAKVVIVPGALYQERPDMGGDGRLVREVAAKFGYKTDVIPLLSFGSVKENARLIRSWFYQHSGERMILVSLSKGGTDLKMALAAPDAQTLHRNVIAWVNVCGPLNGSRMANWILASRWRTMFVRAKCRWQQRDFQLITDLRHESAGPLNFQPPLPPSMKMFSLVGFPLKTHMTTRFSRFCHRTLAAYGPNDGTTSLSDLIAWPGDIFPAWGMDHYFRPENEVRNLVAAMFKYLAEEWSSASNAKP